jgi:two-component system chemotaxis sensor kinase CheA
MDLVEIIGQLQLIAANKPLNNLVVQSAPAVEVPLVDAVAEEEAADADQDHDESDVVLIEDHTKENPVVAEKTKQTDAPPPSAPTNQSAQTQAKASDTTIRVEVARLDELMNLVGELVLGRNRLSQINFRMNESFEGNPITRDLADTSSQVDLITTELQMAVMKTRMVPIAKVFNKLPRLVRDLSRELAREIDLQIYGEETELDKSIIEAINDPLVHILRNSADHGIESPEDRVKAGKSAKGTVIVKAENEGNHIVISIQDDGKGIDTEKIKNKAIEKGLITAVQAAEMSKREALNIIFAPGFSMAAKVTNVSGRGVGMDVVKTNIAKLKGIVDIESEIGVGSKFIIKLPLTLAIIQGLLVQTSAETIAIPLNSVLEVVRVRKEEIETIHGYEVIRLRDTVLPLARMGSIFAMDYEMKSSEWQYIVVVGLAEERLGIAVDSLLGQREVVIKSLGDYLGTIPGIAGSTILGDGKVIMIIDVGQFMQMARTKTQSHSSFSIVEEEGSLAQAN